MRRLSIIGAANARTTTLFYRYLGTAMENGRGKRRDLTIPCDDNPETDQNDHQYEYNNLQVQVPSVDGTVGHPLGAA